MKKKNNEDIEFMDMDMDMEDGDFSEITESGNPVSAHSESTAEQKGISNAEQKEKSNPEQKEISNAEQKEKSNPKQKKKSKTKYVFLVYTLLLLIGMFVFLRYCNKSLQLYEAAQPEYVMENVLLTISANGIDALDTSDISFHELEAGNDFFTSFDHQLRTADLTYKKLRENYSDGALIYGIYDGDTLLAEASLLPGNSYQRIYLLTITEWKLSGITAIQPAGSDFLITATIPDNYTITVNDIPLDEAYQTGFEEVEMLNYCKSYVDTPGFVSYRVSGLANEPDIVIYDFNGNVAWKNEAYENNAVDIQLDFLNRELTDSEEDQAMRDMILEGVERYSNFFSKDLPGCRESIDPIRDLFPEDSIYLTLADQYRREDMGVFSSHTNTHFENEEISEFTWYSEDCFSCRVSFDKSMTLGREIIDTTNNVYYYVKLDGAWVIADIQ